MKLPCAFFHSVAEKYVWLLARKTPAFIEINIMVSGRNQPKHFTTYKPKCQTIYSPNEAVSYLLKCGTKLTFHQNLHGNLCNILSRTLSSTFALSGISCPLINSWILFGSLSSAVATRNQPNLLVCEQEKMLFLTWSTNSCAFEKIHSLGERQISGF